MVGGMREAPLEAGGVGARLIFEFLGPSGAAREVELSRSITSMWESICSASSLMLGLSSPSLSPSSVDCSSGGRGLERVDHWQWYLGRKSEWRSLKEVEGIHDCHPTLLQSQPLSFEDDRATQILSIGEAHVIEHLLGLLHCLL